MTAVIAGSCVAEAPNAFVEVVNLARDQKENSQSRSPRNSAAGGSVSEVRYTCIRRNQHLCHLAGCHVRPEAEHWPGVCWQSNCQPGTCVAGGVQLVDVVAVVDAAAAADGDEADYENVAAADEDVVIVESCF